MKSEAEYHRGQISKTGQAGAVPGSARANLIIIRKRRLAVLEKKLAQGASGQ